MAKKLAMGFLECAGYGAALYAMDKACKAAQIRILGIDTINPKDSSAFIPMTTQVKFEGPISDVEIAAEIAREAALRFNSEKEVLCSVIDYPYDGVDKLGAISKVKLQPEK